MSTKRMINIGDLKPKSYYNAPLYIDDDYILLSTGTAITESLLENLRAWGYKEVWTEGSPVSGSSPAGVETVFGAVLNTDAKEAEGRRKAQTFFEDFTGFTRRVYELFSRDLILDMESITQKMKDTIQMMKDYKSYMLRLTYFKSDRLAYIYAHSARTVIISLCIGETMKLPNFRLIELGIAAILHEVGMMKIPRQIYDKASELTETEKILMATHPFQGMKMLQEYARKNTIPLSQDILMGVWQHHERSNGSGYPQGISGDEITLFGKIIAVACSYDARISKRTHREAMDGHTSMLMMLKEIRNLYDEKVISALLNSISIYPLGSCVRLRNGAIGIVVDTDPEKPKSPMVRLHLDDNIHVYKGHPIIRTREEDGLNIVGVLKEQEIDDLVTQGLLPGG